MTCRDAIGWSDVAAAADIVRLGADVSGGARMKKTRVWTARKIGESHIFIGRGS